MSEAVCRRFGIFRATVDRRWRRTRGVIRDEDRPRVRYEKIATTSSSSGSSLPPRLDDPIGRRTNQPIPHTSISTRAPIEHEHEVLGFNRRSAAR
jgi:hypothetical protein